MIDKKEISFRSAYKFLSNKNLGDVLGIKIESNTESKENFDFVTSLSEEDKKAFLIAVKDEVLLKDKDLKATYEQIEEDTTKKGETLFDWQGVTENISFFITGVTFLKEFGVFDAIKNRFAKKDAEKK